MKVTGFTFVGYVFIVMAIILAVTVLYMNNTRRAVPIVFSPEEMLRAVWEKYKGEYLEQGTLRTLDKQRGGITTSEGQSYTMLRAVWMDDQPTFDTSWKWTQDNLELKNAHIFSWLFGKRRDGTYGILTDQGGQNTASDADTDIALALSFAYARWKDPRYLENAQQVMRDIWSQEVVLINGKPYMAADNLEKKYNGDVLVDPSYLSPYAYRVFAEIDPSHDWNGLVDTSYHVLQQSISLPLDKTWSAHMPPNWIMIDRFTAAVKAPKGGANLDTDYSYDALRIPWRIALDWQWYKDPRAENLLKSMSFLDRQWQQKGALYVDYSHDGMARVTNEVPSMYGGSLGAILAIDPIHAKSIYEAKLKSLFSPDNESWKVPLGYFDDNWAWFGIAMYNNDLPNLWQSMKKKNNNPLPT